MKLKRCEVYIELRYKGGNNRQLIARMVEWVPAENDEGMVPVFGRCLLSPNIMTDPDKAVRHVHKMLDHLCDKIHITVIDGRPSLILQRRETA